MSRSTRSRSKQASQLATPDDTPTTPLLETVSRSDTIASTIDVLPKKFTTKITGLIRKDNSLLISKRAKLRNDNTQLQRFIRDASESNINGASALIQPVEASLVFAQEEAGTAICISPEGLLLTCSHCVADDEQAALSSTPHWLIFATGEVVRAVCVAWDARRDLALLRIVAAEPPILRCDISTASSNSGILKRTTFPYASLPTANSKLKLRAPLLCVGHPGSEDLEANEPGTQTGYDVLHISDGSFRGLQSGQDPLDNSEIGALKHDCWTYWGHSGAPLIERATGKLVGLHSSWDDQTGMRRGVSLEAIRAFLAENAFGRQSRGAGGSAGSGRDAVQGPVEDANVSLLSAIEQDSEIMELTAEEFHATLA